MCWANFFGFLVVFWFACSPTTCVKNPADEIPQLRESYFSIGAHMNGDSFGRKLQTNFRRFLAVDRIQEFIDDSEIFEEITVDEGTVDETVTRLDDSLASLSGLLSTSFATNSTTSEFIRSVPPCSIFRKVLTASSSQACYILHNEDNQLTENYTNIVLQKASNASAVRRQFLFVDNELHLELPAEFVAPTVTAPHIRQFLAAKAPNPKNLIVAIDLGMISSPELLSTVKEAALILIDSASSRDRLRVVVGSNGVVLTFCDAKSLVERDRARRVVKALRLATNSSDETSLAATVSAAFDVLAEENFEPARHRDNIFFFISRGVFSELSEARRVLSALARKIVDVKSKNIEFKINSLLVAEANRCPSAWSYEFLENVARQNFTCRRNTIDSSIFEKLNSLKVEPSRGEILVLNKSVGEQLNWSKMLKMFTVNPSKEDNRSKSKDRRVEWTNNLDDMTLSAFQSVNIGGRRIISGFDLSIDELFDDIFRSYYIRSAPDRSRLVVSVVDVDGVVVASSQNTVRRRLDDVDSWPTSSRWLNVYFDDANTQRGTFSVNTDKFGSLSYFWRKLKNAPLTVVMSSREGVLPLKISRVQVASKQTFSMQHVLWHKNDERQQKCKLYGNFVTPHFSSVFVPQSAYHPVAKRLLTGDALRNNWVYLFDNVGFIRSNSLRRGVREHIGILSNFSKTWLDIDIDGGDSPVIRRYAATIDGSFVVSPAQTIKDDYEPTKQKWFIDAARSPDKLIISGPVVNEQLAEVVTISMAITRRKTQVVAVVAIDIPSGAFDKWVKDGVQSCGQSRRCLLFVPDGNVVYFESDPDKPRSPSDAVERFHISHVEPILAAKMSRVPEVVNKAQCRDKKDEIQRTTTWNTKFTRVFTIGCGESSSPFGPLHSETLLVPGTNIFLAMINSTCIKPVLGAFCPCSVSDRRCLFCEKFEPRECECPCQCANQEACQKPEIPVCDENAENEEMSVHEEYTSNYKSCYVNKCSSHQSATSCRSTPSCEWCSFTSSGLPVATPTCAPISTCYQSVQERTVNRNKEAVDTVWPTKAPFGPLVAGIIAFFFLVLLLVYCYRSQMSRLVERRVLFDSSGMPLFHRHGPPFEFDVDGTAFRELKQPVVLASFERMAPIVDRQAPPTVSSDHGYSTMTDRNANEDSECAESVLVSEVGGASSVLSRHPPSQSNDVPSLITTSAVIHRIPDHVLKQLSPTPSQPAGLETL